MTPGNLTHLINSTQTNRMNKGLALISLMISITPLFLLISCFVFHLDPLHHLLQSKCSNSTACISICKIFRLIVYYSCFGICRYVGLLISGLVILWTTLLKCLIVTSNYSTADINLIINSHNEIILCYTLIRELLEPLLSFGIFGFFWAIVLSISFVLRFGSRLPRILGSFLFTWTIPGGYCFICSLGVKVDFNEMSSKVISINWIRMHKCQRRINDTLKRKVLDKRSKSFRQIKIIFRPLGTINTDFQVDYVNTMKSRVVDLLLIYK